ncbi:hypothetical protein [Bradyrhizobium sp. BWC-3-1]|uniref:hypothetical protein n=1 Tax=Bradyrhizobium sp. BWC-3-1 TaxID=3080012 RepID=UPI00293F743A|nr:hypothetical protein [Bradyrhizobium sp. BWC-3-1]WOH60272.1 hypothetical protein RX329_09265 [Bradyrhizobium sp. BWC-3-1]
MGIERMRPPKYWRMRAEEFRTKPDNCQFPETRDTLRKVAENYEELARRAEQVVTLAELDERNLQARRVVREHAGDQRAVATQLPHRMN